MVRGRNPDVLAVRRAPRDPRPAPPSSVLRPSSAPRAPRLAPAVGVVLAGGASRRMGRDKALLPVDGRPLIHRVVGALQAVFDDVLVVGRPPGWLDWPGVRCVDDREPGRGPLGGLATAMAEAAGKPIFAAGCDMPFLSPTAISFVLDMLGDYDATVPLIDGIPQPLHAAYASSCYPIILRHLAEGDLSVRSLIRSLSTHFLAQEDFRQIDPELSSFQSLNTPEEYERVSE
ncbi:MAG TPA: molybdenum cofactor guanylyltransferase [Armatimonadota bacterium]|nr:molybdenum cofactor guanylyltransferase [Armatimonadota bacterium]